MLIHGWFSTRWLDLSLPTPENKWMAAQLLNSALRHSENLIYQHQHLTPCVRVFLIAFPVADSPRSESVFRFYASNVPCMQWHKHTHLENSLTHIHTPFFHLFLSKRQTAGSWASAAVVQCRGTDSCRRANKKRNEQSQNRERRRGQVVLSNPPPGWPRVKYCTASSDTGDQNKAMAATAISAKFWLFSLDFLSMNHYRNEHNMTAYCLFYVAHIT